MLNAAKAVGDERVLNVLDGVELHGRVNVTDDALLDNIRSAIRRGHPQVRPQPARPERVCIVGGGPSLHDTLPELRELMFEGALIVTVNGAYHWCIERNIRPQTQLIMDARDFNARFVQPYVPRCRYVLASQCHPAVFDAVQDYDNVWLFHAATADDEAIRRTLDAYYFEQWYGIGGGTTVVSRALSLLRTLGYLRFDLFGVDSCWMDGQNHAYSQPENARDRRFRIEIHPTGHPEARREFHVAPWHLKQLEDMTQMIRVNGDHFLLNVHGDGLLAYALRSCAAGFEVEASPPG
jgi:hypothetical protein